MSGATSLTPEEAQAKITQVDEAMSSARLLGQSMQDRTLEMTSSSWQGDQATRFAQRMQAHNEDFTAIINRLTQVAETGKSNMTSLVNLEAE
ncbi:WXG100 family type VII secretion target [Mycolicibacterium arenosum]|uniref:WXG100 family type VII secretion target n=1 Tax=Mycolicibacterium arenosum TaxID=2952157 RepID=A0ABT1LZE7_9MYCO|nr:WXG100 family type VII secretion target [Mycolicibacterium sp. CAU 1645]MCP9271547.1 WXG100 family type VII secretion target [Mycolicibacterium sp. CAU 1645]